MRRDERMILLLGVGVLAAALGGLGVLAAVAPDVARAVVLQVGSHLLVGKETGLPVGLAAGAPPLLAWAYAVAQDAVVLLVGFPVMLALRARLMRTRRGARFFDAVHARAAAHTVRGEWAGAAALAATTWVPFLPSGALVAALAGAVLGVRARILLPVLVAASAVAALAYTLAYARVLAFAGALDPRLPLAVAAAVVLLFGLGGLIGARRARTG